MYESIKLLHLIAAIVWMGGMTCLLFAVRPAALGTLDAQPRARLMVQIWRRFFAMVAVAVVLLLATGGHLYSSAFRAARAAGGSGGLPLGWNLMLAIGLLMFLIFGHIYFAGFKKFSRAVAAAEWPLAGKTAGLIHKLVVANFVLGWLAIICLRLVH